ncbi:MAG: YdeI/OmpD-associated family protein [Deltaproteobacteria bacterium]|nr:YdeI/OmpD-associated family protein [Deltaproteobacteria bacterium]
MKQVYVKTRKEWRNWLNQNHDKSNGIWLVFYKKHAGKATLEYDEAVEEALCFGWIDSIIKKIDDEKYVRKLTPRHADSRWSELNKNRITKLKEQGLLTKAGIVKVREAKTSGLWNKSDKPQIPLNALEELESALATNKKAKSFYDQLAPSYQKRFVGWISAAKRKETKERRLRESIALLEHGERLGMK